MKQYTVHAPDTCGLVVRSGGLVYISFAGAVTYTSDDATFETFPTPEAAAARAKELQPDFDAALLIFGIPRPPDWDPQATYKIGDLVWHISRRWKATSDNTGNEPDGVAGDWEVVSI